MSHYESEHWADFARDLTSEEERRSMSAHLQAGCERCRRKAELLGELAATRESERRYDPPAEVMRLARAIYQRPSRPEKLSSILARLVYDSMRDPLPAGMRSSDRPSQVLYEAGDYLLDLHVNRERTSREHGAPRMVLVGQLASRKRPGARLGDVPVLVKSGEDVAASATSNRLGEFHVEYSPGRGLRLEIPVGKGRKIEVPLPSVEAA